MQKIMKKIENVQIFLFMDGFCGDRNMLPNFCARHTRIFGSNFLHFWQILE